jgi:hypothetical protein
MKYLFTFIFGYLIYFTGGQILPIGHESRLRKIQLNLFLTQPNESFMKLVK